MEAKINPEDSLVTTGDEWEKKVISYNEVVGVEDSKDILALFRDWLLGGKHLDWKYMRDNVSGDLILWRR